MGNSALEKHLDDGDTNAVEKEKAEGANGKSSFKENRIISSSDPSKTRKWSFGEREVGTKGAPSAPSSVSDSVSTEPVLPELGWSITSDTRVRKDLRSFRTSAVNTEPVEEDSLRKSEAIPVSGPTREGSLPIRPKMGTVASAAAVIVNFLLFRLLVQLDSFQAVRDDLLLLVQALFLVISSYFAFSSLKLTAQRMILELKQKEIGLFFLLFVGISGLVLATTLRLILNPIQDLLSTSFDSFIIGSACLVCLLDGLKNLRISLWTAGRVAPHCALTEPGVLEGRVEGVGRSHEGIESNSTTVIERKDQTASNLELEEIKLLQERVLHWGTREIGSLLPIDAGAVVPVDAKVVTGSLVVREKMGQAYGTPKMKLPGSFVTATALVLSGEGELEVLRNIDASEPFLLEREANEIFLDPSSSDSFRDSNIGLYGALLLFVAGISGTAAWYSTHSLPAGMEVMSAVLFAVTFLEYLGLRRFLNNFARVELLQKGAFVRGLNSFLSILDCRKVLVDCSKRTDAGFVELKRVDLLDSRYSREALLGVVFSAIAAREEDDLLLSPAILQSLFNEIDPTTLRPVVYESIQRGEGIVYRIDGVRIVFGTEQFLLGHGVQLQATEAGEEECYLLAIHGEPVLRLYLAPSGIRSFERLGRLMRRTGRELLFTSEMDHNSLRSWARLRNIPLESVRSELDKVRYGAELSREPSVLGYATDPRIISIFEENGLCASSVVNQSDFTKPADILFLGNGIDGLTDLFGLLDRFKIVQRWWSLVGWICFLGLTVGAVAGVVPAYGVIFGGAISIILVQYLLKWLSGPASTLR